MFKTQIKPQTQIAVAQLEVLSDASLMAHVQNGDGHALEELYRRHGARMLGLAAGIVYQRAIAEELVQEAFIRIWLKAETFDPVRGDGKGWLLTIVRNRCLDYVRREKTHAPQIEFDASEDLPDEGGTAWELIETNWVQAQVRAALSSLPREQREVLHLSYYGGLTRRDIAARLRVPEGTIHTRARLALIKLKELLGALRLQSAGD
jgi:RNA polymerase sigma-70 factor (ECF subfamily)